MRHDRATAQLSTILYILHILDKVQVKVDVNVEVRVKDKIEVIVVVKVEVKVEVTNEVRVEVKDKAKARPRSRSKARPRSRLKTWSVEIKRDILNTRRRPSRGRGHSVGQGRGQSRGEIKVMRVQSFTKIGSIEVVKKVLTRFEISVQGQAK